MKLFAFACVLLVASATALPKNDVLKLGDEVQIVENNDFESREARLISNTIVRMIQEFSRQIVAAGLDPFYREFHVIEHNIPFVANVRAVVERLSFSGLSNIVVRTMDYSILTNRLRFDVSMPRISLSVENVDVTARVLLQTHKAEMNGFLNINEIRLRGEVRVNIGIISGISIRSIDIQFSVGNINADVYAVAFGQNYSDQINYILNELIPALLRQYEADINRFLADLVRFIVDML